MTVLKTLLAYTKQHHMTFIDPFNNVHTIAGQGTITKELISEAERSSSI